MKRLALAALALVLFSASALADGVQFTQAWIDRRWMKPDSLIGSSPTLHMNKRQGIPLHSTSRLRLPSIHEKLPALHRRIVGSILCSSRITRTADVFSALPFVGVLSYTNIQTAPPVNTYTVTSPQETEIDVYVINSVSCPGEFGPYKDGGACVEANSRMYRFVHNYSLRAGAIYPSQAQPQITRDRLWVAFSSTYMVHLGTVSDPNPAHDCVTAAQCRTDIFLVHLGDAGVR